MNIFYLHHNPIICAEMHNDKHCVKMILETAQILSTVHHRYNTHVDTMYKPTHKNHPSTVWAGDDKCQYFWLYDLLCALCDEYTHRYGKIHKVERSGLLEALSIPPDSMPHAMFAPPPQCMPDECKVDGDTIDAYRKYYIDKKASFSKWTNRAIPDWFAINQWGVA